MSIINPQLAALKERFISGLPARIERMKALHELMRTSQSIENENPFQREAHSLVGAAGIHGLSEIALAASHLNQALVEKKSASDIGLLLNQLSDVVSAPSTPPDAEKLTKGESSRRILIAVEGRDERESSQALFENLGLTVFTASSVSEVKQRCKHGSAPDLVVLGMQFGNDAQAGLDLLLVIRECWPDIPCILTMSPRSVQVQLDTYRHGAVHVMTKPFSSDTLKQLTLQLIDGKNFVPKVLVLGQLPPSLVDELNSWTICNSIEDLLHKAENGRADAVVIRHSTHLDETNNLTRLVVDHPSTAHLPTLWLSLTEDPTLWVKATSLGAVATLGLNLSAAEMIQIVSAHAKRAQTHARRSRELLSLMYEVNRQRLALDHHTIVSLANAHGDIIETSANHVHLAGYALDQILGGNLTENRTGKAPPELPAVAWQQAINGEVWQGQISVRRQDDTVRWVEATLVPFLTPQGKPYQFLLARTDITSRVESETALMLARQNEMQTASIIQKTLLVAPLPLTVSGAGIGAQFRASSGLAGDFHELIDLGNQCFDVVLGDVMGKGMGAALIAAGLKLELSRCFSEAIQDNLTTRPEPAQIVRTLNSKLTPKLIELGSFVTMSYLRCDLKNQTVTSIGCGHPETLLLKGDEIEKIPNLNLPIGILEDEPYSHSIHKLLPGSTLVLYSDGLSEAVDDLDQEFGSEGIQQAVMDPHMNNQGARTTALAIMDQLHTFTRDQVQKDDQTLIVIKTPLPKSVYLHFPRNLQALPLMREKIQAFASAHSIDPTDLGMVFLACTEVFSNIIKHATATDEDQAIVMALLRTTDGIEAEFTDLSQAFLGSDEPKMPAMEEMALGGYGLGLIATVTESVLYSHHHGVNHCHLRFLCPNSSNTSNSFPLGT